MLFPSAVGAPTAPGPSSYPGPVLRRLRGQDANGGVAAKTVVVLIVVVVALGSAPVLVPVVRWLMGVLT